MYRPNPKVSWSPTEREKVELGDRVLTLRSDEGVRSWREGALFLWFDSAM